MSTTWYIEYAGLRRPLASWGITACSCRFRSLDVDELTLGTKVGRLSGSPLFSYGATVSLYRDSVRWFTGTVTALPTEGSGTEELASYTVSGPWWQLDNLIFQDDRKVPIDPDDATSELQTVFTSHVVLFQDLNLAKRSIDQQITRVLAYAAGKGASIATGTIDPDFDVPWEEARDATCGEVLRRCTRWAPDSVSWYDYTTSPPTLHIRRRANLSATTWDLDAATGLTEWSLSRREDLAPKGVTIIIQRRKTQATGGTKVYFERQIAGDATAGIGSVVMTVPLAGDGSTEEPVPVGLAADFFSACSTVGYEGQFAWTQAEVTGVARPGQVINLLNARSEHATMAAVVQQVSEDIVKGRTTVTVGLPAYLGARDLLELARVNRTRQGDGTAALGRSSGFTDGASLPLYEQIVVCAGNTEKSINIRIN